MRYAMDGSGFAILTFIAVDATPDNERNYGVEGGGERSHNFLET